MNKNLNENYQNIIEKSVVQIYSQKIEIVMDNTIPVCNDNNLNDNLESRCELFVSRKIKKTPLLR